MPVHHSWRSIAVALAASACGAPLAHAAAAADDATTLAPVIITAQHRDESVQLVPIAVTVVTGKTIEDSGFQNLTDLQFLVPGVQYDPTQGAAFQIRGVGSTSFDFSNEKSVNVVVDDVVMDAQRENGLTGLSDIQRVDVLMGPQGTLFGKNSTSGAIVVTTANPVLGQFSAKAAASFGERNDRNTNATVNIPLGTDLAVRVTAFDQGQDGPGQYTTVHKSLGAFEDWGYRAKLLYKPNDGFQLLVLNDYQHHWDSSIRVAVSGQPAIVASTQAALGVTAGPQNGDDADSSVGAIVTTSQGTSIQAKLKIGGDTLTSITAVRETTYNNDTPADLVPTSTFAYIPFNSGRLKTSKVSQELRWASPTGQFVEYVGGLFYNKLIADQTQLQWATLGAPLNASTTKLFALTGAIGAPGNISKFMARNTTAAAYGQLKFNLTPKFNIALGGRYSYDDNSQSLSYPFVDPVPLVGHSVTFQATSAQPFQPAGSLVGHNFSYRIAPEYRLTDDVMLYASYSTGYKPGGVAFVGNKYDPFREETVKAYEVGVKSELFGHRLRLNADAFNEDFKQFQATILTAIPGSVLLQSVIGNAGGLKSQGAETTFAWKATDALTLNGSVTYTDAYFTNYVPNTTTNYTNTRLTNAPRWSGFVAADYVRPITDSLTMKATVDYAYRSTLWTVTGQPAYSQVKGYGLVNTRISFQMPSRGLEFGVYARNLFDHYFSTGWQQYGALGLLHYQSLDASRTAGVFLKYAY